ECLIACREELVRKTGQIVSAGGSDLLGKKAMLLELFFPASYKFGEFGKHALAPAELLTPGKKPAPAKAKAPSLAQMLLMDDRPDAGEVGAPETPAPDRPKKDATQVLPAAKTPPDRPKGSATRVMPAAKPAPPKEPEPGERTTRVGMPAVTETPARTEEPAPIETPAPTEKPASAETEPVAKAETPLAKRTQDGKLAYRAKQKLLDIKKILKGEAEAILPISGEKGKVLASEIVDKLISSEMTLILKGGATDADRDRVIQECVKVLEEGGVIPFMAKKAVEVMARKAREIVQIKYAKTKRRSDKGKGLIGLFIAGLVSIFAFSRPALAGDIPGFGTLASASTAGLFAAIVIFFVVPSILAKVAVMLRVRAEIRKNSLPLDIETDEKILARIPIVIERAKKNAKEEIKLQDGNTRHPFGVAADLMDGKGNIIAEAKQRIPSEVGDDTPKKYDHAEIVVFDIAEDKEKENWSDYTLITSLEPCDICAQAIINRGIKKVVIATLDPGPLMGTGEGVRALRWAGIEVTIAPVEHQKEVLEHLCDDPGRIANTLKENRSRQLVRKPVSDIEELKKAIQKRLAKQNFKTHHDRFDLFEFQKDVQELLSIISPGKEGRLPQICAINANSLNVGLDVDKMFADRVPAYLISWSKQASYLTKDRRFRTVIAGTNENCRKVISDIEKHQTSLDDVYVLIGFKPGEKCEVVKAKEFMEADSRHISPEREKKPKDQKTVPDPSRRDFLKDVATVVGGLALLPVASYIGSENHKGKIVVCVLDSLGNMTKRQRDDIRWFRDLKHGSVVYSIIRRSIDKEEIYYDNVDMLFYKMDEEPGKHSRRKYLNALLSIESYVNTHPDDKVVINASFGGEKDDPSANILIKRLLEKGVIIVAAVGNDNSEKVGYPAAQEGVIAVAASDGDGKASYSNYGNEIDLVADGSFTSVQRRELPVPGGRKIIIRTTTVNGTSFAAPRVTAAIVKMLHFGMRKPEIRADINERIIDALRKTSKPLDSRLYREGKLGSGVVSVEEAVERFDPGYRWQYFRKWLKANVFRMVLFLMGIELGSYAHKMMKGSAPVDEPTSMARFVGVALGLIAGIVVFVIFTNSASVRYALPVFLRGYTRSNFGRILLTAATIGIFGFIGAAAGKMSFYVSAWVKIHYYARKKDINGLMSQSRKLHCQGTRMQIEILKAITKIGEKAMPRAIDWLLHNSHRLDGEMIKALGRLSEKYPLKEHVTKRTLKRISSTSGTASQLADWIMHHLKVPDEELKKLLKHLDEKTSFVGFSIDEASRNRKEKLDVLRALAILGSKEASIEASVAVSHFKDWLTETLTRIDEEATDILAEFNQKHPFVDYLIEGARSEAYKKDWDTDKILNIFGMLSKEGDKEKVVDVLYELEGNRGAAHKELRSYPVSEKVEDSARERITKCVNRIIQHIEQEGWVPSEDRDKILDMLKDYAQELPVIFFNNPGEFFMALDSETRRTSVNLALLDDRSDQEIESIIFQNMVRSLPRQVSRFRIIKKLTQEMGDIRRAVARLRGMPAGEARRDFCEKIKHLVALKTKNEFEALSFQNRYRKHSGDDLGYKNLKDYFLGLISRTTDRKRREKYFKLSEITLPDGSLDPDKLLELFDVLYPKPIHHWLLAVHAAETGKVDRHEPLDPMEHPKWILSWLINPDYCEVKPEEESGDQTPPRAPPHGFRPLSWWSLVGLGGGVDWTLIFGGLAMFSINHITSSWHTISVLGFAGFAVLGIIGIIFTLTSFTRVMDSIRVTRKAHPDFGFWRALTYDIGRDKATLDKLREVSLYTRYQILNHETYRFHIPGLLAFLPEIITTKKLKKLVAKRIGASSKKILLIASPISNFMLRESGRNAGYFVAPPYGLYRMKSYLEKKQLAKVDVFDPNLYPEDAKQRLEQKILSGGYDVVGFSLTHVNMRDELDLIARVKEVSESNGLTPPLLIGGGTEATHNHKQWLEESLLDGVAVGYGETVLEEIIKKFPQKQKTSPKKWLEKIAGFAVLDEQGNVNINFARPVSQEMFRELTLDNGPTDAIPYQDYWDFNGRLYEPQNLRVRGATLKAVRLFTSSHCLNGCGFCSSSNFLSAATGKSHTPIVYLSAKDIFDLVLQNVRRHNPEAIFFNDDDFIIDNKEKDTRKRILDFCGKVKGAKEEGHIQRDLKFYIQTKTRNVTLLDKVTDTYVPDLELLKAMKEAGFVLAALGVESFSDQVLRSPAVGKKATKKMAIAAVDALLRADITPLVNIILLTPDMKKEDFVETADQVVKFAQKGVQFSVNPFIEYFPGAPAFRGIEEEGGYSFSTKRVVSQKTKTPFSVPVNLKPNDPVMATVAEGLAAERTAVLTELQTRQGWSFIKYPSQIINGLISFMAVYRLLSSQERDRSERDEMARKAQEIERVILQLISIAKPTRGTGVIHSRQEFSHLVERAHVLMRAPEMTYEKAADLINIAGELKHIWPNTYQRIIGHLSQFAEDIINKKIPFEGNGEVVNCVAHGLARVDVESIRTEKLLALLNFFFGVITPILNDYYVDEENVVTFVPKGPVADEPGEIEEEFSGKNVMIFEPHHDDVLSHLGNIMEQRIVPKADKTTFVTLLNDPSGVEDDYAERFAREGEHDYTGEHAKRRLKMTIRRTEGIALAKALGVQEYVSLDGYAPVREGDAVRDERGRLLSYQSVFSIPVRRIGKAVYKRLCSEEPDIIMMPLPKGAYHQNHRDTSRILIKEIMAYNKLREQQGKEKVKVYFYTSNIDQDGFTTYGIDPNVINFFPKEGSDRKKELFGIYASQLARYGRYTELLHRLDMDCAQRELARRRHAGKEPHELYAETLLKVDIVPSEFQKKKEAEAAARDVERSVNIITTNLSHMEGGYLRIHIFDGNVFFETPGTFDFLPIQAGEIIAGKNGLMEKLGLVSIIVDHKACMANWKVVEGRVRKLVSTLRKGDVAGLSKLMRDDLGMVRAEVFSAETDACKEAGITPIYWRDLVDERIRGKKRVVVNMHQPGYQKYMGFFQKMAQADVFVFTDVCQYVEQEWMNRQNFRDPEGKRDWLTVPVLKGPVSDRVMDKEIDSTKSWQKAHWNALLHTYRDEPYFERYAKFFEELYRRRWRSLNGLNEVITRYLTRQLGIKDVLVIRSSQMGEISGKKAGLMANVIERAIGEDAIREKEVVYISGRGALSYLNREVPGQAGILEMDVLPLKGIGVELQRYSPQDIKEKWGVEPFNPALEILFQVGPQAREILAASVQVTSLDKSVICLQEAAIRILSEIREILRKKPDISLEERETLEFHVKSLEMIYRKIEERHSGKTPGIIGDILIDATEPIDREEVIRLIGEAQPGTELVVWGRHMPDVLREYFELSRKDEKVRENIVNIEKLAPERPSGRKYKYELLGGDELVNMYTGEGRNINPDLGTVNKEILKRSCFLVMAAGAGTRLAELLSMSFEDRVSLGIGDIDPQKIDVYSKSTMPFTNVMHKNPLQLAAESLAALCRDEDVDIPLTVVCTKENRSGIIRLLRENGNFGLKNVILIEDFSGPPVFDSRGRVLIEEQEFVHSGGGTGGSLRTLSNKNITVIERDGSVSQDEKLSPFDWMELYHVKDLYFLQCDMVYTPELLRSLVLAKNREGKRLDLVAMGYNYPPGSKYQLGTIFRRRYESEVDYEVVEHRDRTLQLQELVGEAQADQMVPAYAGALGINIDIARYVVARPDESTPYIHWNKRERLEDGTEVVVNKIQYSLTNLFQATDRVGVLMVPFEDVSPMKDPHKLASVRASLGDRHKEFLKAKGVKTISDESAVEMSPLARIDHVGENVSIADNAKVYFGGSPNVLNTIAIGDNVTFGEDVTVKFAGNNVVFVENNVTFRGEGEVVLDVGQAERVVIPAGHVVETGKSRSPRRGTPIRSIMNISDEDLLSLLPSELNRRHIGRIIRIFDILWELDVKGEDEEKRARYKEIFHKFVIAHAMGSHYGTPGMLKSFRHPDEYYRILGENNIIIPHEIDLFLRYSVFREKAETFKKIDGIKFGKNEEDNEELKKWLRKLYVYFAITDSIEMGSDYLRREEVRRLKGEDPKTLECPAESFMFARKDLLENGIKVEEFITSEVVDALSNTGSSEYWQIEQVSNEAASPVGLKVQAQRMAQFRGWANESLLILEVIRNEWEETRRATSGQVAGAYDRFLSEIDRLDERIWNIDFLEAEEFSAVTQPLADSFECLSALRSRDDLKDAIAGGVLPARSNLDNVDKAISTMASIFRRYAEFQDIILTQGDAEKPVLDINASKQPPRRGPPMACLVPLGVGEMIPGPYLWIAVGVVAAVILGFIIKRLIVYARKKKFENRIIRLVKDLDRGSAVREELVKIGKPAVSALETALGNEDWNVRHQAAIALGEIGLDAEGTLHTLVEILRDKDEEKYVREAAIRAIGKIRFFSVKNVGKRVRTAEFIALGNEVGVVYPLEECLRDDDPDIRLAAVRALGDIGPKAEHAVNILVYMLKDDNAEIREETARTLGRIGFLAKAAIPYLKARRYHGDDEKVLRAVSDAIEKIDPEGRSGLTDFFTSGGRGLPGIGLLILLSLFVSRTAFAREAIGAAGMNIGVFAIYGVFALIAAPAVIHLVKKLVKKEKLLGKEGFYENLFYIGKIFSGVSVLTATVYLLIVGAVTSPVAIALMNCVFIFNILFNAIFAVEFARDFSEDQNPGLFLSSLNAVFWNILFLILNSQFPSMLTGFAMVWGLAASTFIFFTSMMSSWVITAILLVFIIAGSLKMFIGNYHELIRSKALTNYAFKSLPEGTGREQRISTMVRWLKGSDSFQRSTAAQVLRNYNWHPGTDEEKILLYIELWKINSRYLDELAGMGAPAVDLLLERLSSDDQAETELAKDTLIALCRRDPEALIGMIDQALSKGDSGKVGMLESIAQEAAPERLSGYKAERVRRSLRVRPEGSLTEGGISGSVRTLKGANSFERHIAAQILLTRGWIPRTDEEKILLCIEVWRIERRYLDELAGMGEPAVDLLLGRLSSDDQAETELAKDTLIALCRRDPEAFIGMMDQALSEGEREKVKMLESIVQEADPERLRKFKIAMAKKHFGPKWKTWVILASAGFGVALILAFIYYAIVYRRISKYPLPLLKGLADLQTGESGTRICAARDLGNMKDKRAVGFLIKALYDSNVNVVLAATLALGDIGPTAKKA
ncbi:MAG: WbqC family protein, partial [Candidatus Omnitrophota bacterium]